MLSLYLKTLRDKIRNKDIVDIEEVEHEINDLIGSARFYEGKYKDAKKELEKLKEDIKLHSKQM